jgi:aspartokinase
MRAWWKTHIYRLSLISNEVPAAGWRTGEAKRFLGRLYIYMSQDSLHSSGPARGRDIAVVKIGGSILTSAKAYRRAAIFVRDMLKANPEERFVVVVSAQEGATDALERAATKIHRVPNSAARDLLWSTGEIRSVALLTLHLEALGIKAAPLNIHEAGLTLPETAREAGRIHLHAGRLSGVLADFSVAVVPGFFATNAASQIVSLGRGGSDLTAVLLAEGLRACRCELIKDVPGYFTSDPHRDAAARHVPFLSFEQAISMAADGCNLVQRQAIEAAARCKLPLVIRSVRKNSTVSRIAHAPIEVERFARERNTVSA